MIAWLTCLTVICVFLTAFCIILAKLVINIRRVIIYNNESLRSALDQLYNNFLANPNYPPRLIEPTDDFDEDMRRLGINVEGEADVGQ